MSGDNKPKLFNFESQANNYRLGNFNPTNPVSKSSNIYYSRSYWQFSPGVENFHVKKLFVFIVSQPI